MSSTKKSIMEILREQSRYCGMLGSPLYAHLLGNAAADFTEGGPTAEILQGHEADPAGSALALRFMGAIHRLVLEGDADLLAQHYPSTGGKPSMEKVWSDFRDTIEANVQTLRTNVERPVQTNEPGRCAALIGGFLEAARTFGPMLRVLEVGASAGLNLRFDAYRYEARGRTWGPADSPVRLCSYNTQRVPPFETPAEVVERKGCDPSPLDPSSPEDQLTLMSYVWPDQIWRHRLLRGALEVAARIPVEVERAGGPDWIRARSEERVEGVTTVVFHSIVMQYMSRPDRAAFATAVTQAGEAATKESPWVWLRMEPAGDVAEVRFTAWPGGEERLIARTGYHGDPVEWMG